MSEMIIGVVKKHHYHVSEYYYMNFIINVLVILSRSDYSYGYCVDDASDCDNSEPEMCIAKEITKQCEKLNNISYENFDDVSIHVKNILYGFITKAENTIPSSKIHYLPKEFVSKIRSILHDVFSYYNLDINYELFLGVFCFHVWEMLKRCERSLPFAPSSVSVKQTDPYVYEISVRIAHEISTQFNVVIPDSEINLIAVHIGYAIEQDYPVDETIHYIIISDNYHGIADKIKKEIELKYDKRAQFQGLYNSLNDVPFRLAISSMIISTKPPVMTPFNITTVSPFFKYQDQKAISEAIEKMIDKQKKNEFAKLFFAYSNSDSFVNASYPMDYLEAIHILAGKAVSDNIVDNDFESHVLERERLSSTAFFNKFAVPHSNMLVAKATRLYIMINRYGISWKSQTVKVVLLIVIDHTASKEFRKLYNIIIETLSNDETIMKNIDKIKSLDDFVALIREAQNNV
jgi:lichenan operon transcriptional antiterminator